MSSLFSIVIFGFLSLIGPSTNSPFGNLKKGFLTPLYGNSANEFGGKNVPKQINTQKVCNPNISGPSKNAKSNQRETENRDKLLDEVKIRVLYRDNYSPGHAYVAVGNYEYDFVIEAARRRIFRHDVHNNKLEQFDHKSAQSFKGIGLFVGPQKAEEVFFEMAHRFWHVGSFSASEANCLDFVFNFVCALFDGQCPKKESWPNNFVAFDLEMFDDYSKYKEVRYPMSALERQLIPLPAVNNLHKCVLEEHQLEFRIKNLNCNENGGTCANFVVAHSTGLFDRPVKCDKDLKNPIFVQTKAKKVWKDGESVRIDVVLKAYKCFSMSFVSKFFILDETAKKFMIAKNWCHSHHFGIMNLDELKNHTVNIEFD